MSIEIGKLYRCKEIQGKSPDPRTVFVTSIEKDRGITCYYLNDPDCIYRENIRWATEYWVEVC